MIYLCLQEAYQLFACKNRLQGLTHGWPTQGEREAEEATLIDGTYTYITWDVLIKWWDSLQPRERKSARYWYRVPASWTSTIMLQSKTSKHMKFCKFARARVLFLKILNISLISLIDLTNIYMEVIKFEYWIHIIMSWQLWYSYMYLCLYIILKKNIDLARIFID